MNYSLLEKSHRENQLDSLRILYRNKLSDLNKVRVKVTDSEKRLKVIHEKFEKSNQLNIALQHHLDRMRQLLSDSKAQITFEEDYRLRTNYYISQMSKQSGSTTMALDWRSYKGVIVSPDCLQIQRDRAAGLMLELSRSGFLCFAFSEDTIGDMERISDGFYKFKNEVFLLKWLQAQSVIPMVLCSSIQQSAWFDLIEEKILWYDLCGPENIFLGDDASSKLRHYDLLKQAKYVTYADSSFKKYLYARKDAFFLDANESGHLKMRFN
ncbi:MAG: hypothetical protein LBJ26_15375 [Paenibacillus sp.]|nr:hypothetical protein [Paenibacillus sp.]